MRTAKSAFLNTNSFLPNQIHNCNIPNYISLFANFLRPLPPKHKRTMKTYILFMLMLGLANVTTVNGQGFLKKLTDRAVDRTMQKAEDKLVDELAEKIANQAVKPINRFVDSLFVDSYENETGEKYDPENSEKMAEALASMFGDVEIPESYTFDFTMEIEVKDYGSKKANDMKLYVSKDKPYFGMEQDDDGKKMMFIFDNENQAMVTYDMNKKESMAIPINSMMMSAFGQMAVEKELEKQQLTIKETGDTKKILGYQAKEFVYDTEDAESEVYISEELPFSWEESFGTMMSQFAPNFYKNNPDYKLKGMMLEGKSKRKKDGKKSEWKAKKLSEKTVTITNSDFDQKSIGEYGS